VVWIPGPQPNAGAVVEPQPPAFRLSGRYFQPLTPPYALHPLGIDPPARYGFPLAIPEDKSA
jgi:hypothetical protein